MLFLQSCVELTVLPLVSLRGDGGGGIHYVISVVCKYMLQLDTGVQIALRHTQHVLQCAQQS